MGEGNTDEDSGHEQRSVTRRQDRVSVTIIFCELVRDLGGGSGSRIGHDWALGFAVGHWGRRTVRL